MTTRSKNIGDIFGRALTGKISRNCRSNQHDNWSSDSSKIINILKDKGKVLPKSTEKILRGKNILTGNFICKNCAAMAVKIYGITKKVTNIIKENTTDEENERDERCVNAWNINERIINLVELIEKLNDKSQINLDPLTKVIPNIVLQSLTRYLRSSDVENENGELLETNDLLGAIGENFRETVYNDIKSIRHVYHDPHKLFNVDSRSFINNWSKGVVSFFLGLTGVDLTNATEKVLFSFADAIECLYYLRNLQVISPHSFVCNLIQFYTSGSKTVPVFNNKIRRGGSYLTVHNLLADHGKIPLVCPTGKLIWWEILYF